MSEVTVEGILYALSDPVRARIFVELANTDCTRACNAFARYGKKKLAKSTLSQHFRVLREAGLIRSERVGVSLQNRSRCDEFRGKHGALVAAIINSYISQKEI